MSDYTPGVPWKPAEDAGAALEADSGLRERLAACERRIASLEECLTACAADLSARIDQLSAPAVPQPEPRAESDVEAAWRAAPLELRLRFVRDLLPSDHALQPALKEAAALEDLRGRGTDLEGWISRYPPLFASSAARLNVEQPPAAEAPAGRVAFATLGEARDVLQARLDELGVVWIAPSPGDAVGVDCEVMGEEESDAPAGRVARLQRPGFRLGGETALPAQVLRAKAPVEEAATAVPDQTDQLEPTDRSDDAVGNARRGVPPPNPPAATEPAWDAGLPVVAHPTEPAAEGVSEAPGEPAPEPPPTAEAATEPGEVLHAAPERERPAAMPGADWPDWLRGLQQAAFGHEAPDLRMLMGQLERLAAVPVADDDPEVREAAEPLLPLMGPRYAAAIAELPAGWRAAFDEARPDLLAWLQAAAGITVVAPGGGEAFDPATMEVAEARRTAHPHEDGKVARLERVGLLRHGRVLLPARVLRYELGGGL